MIQLPSPSESAMAPIADNLLAAWSFDDAGGSWKYYAVAPSLGVQNSLAEFIPGETYWVRLLADQTVALNGRERGLTAGWNLID